MKLSLKSNFFGLLSLVVFGVVLTACSGEDGMDGDVGPAGLQGPQGPIGETGVGPVIYSDWFNTQLADPLPDGFNSFTVIAPSITQAIMNEGLVSVYGRQLDEGDEITPIIGLPRFFPSVGREYGFFVEEEGELTIYASKNGVISAQFFNQYRYVIIPANLEGSSGMSGIPNSSELDKKIKSSATKKDNQKNKKNATD